MGNLEMVAAPVALRDDLTDTEFWLLVEPGEDSEVHWWTHTCYRCGAAMTVWWCASTPPWSASRPEEEPMVVGAVLAACNNSPVMSYLEFRTSRPVPRGYMAFCCPRCHSLAGDWFIHKELLELAALGKTNIVSVSI